MRMWDLFANKVRSETNVFYFVQEDIREYQNSSNPGDLGKRRANALLKSLDIFAGTLPSAKAELLKKFLQTGTVEGVDTTPSKFCLFNLGKRPSSAEKETSLRVIVAKAIAKIEDPENTLKGLKEEAAKVLEKLATARESRCMWTF